MIRCNGKIVQQNKFPDGTFAHNVCGDFHLTDDHVDLYWRYEDESELVFLYFFTRHLQQNNWDNIILTMPYLPNARMDRIKDRQNEMFTLKYFAEIINSLNFTKVRSLDVHSNVAKALLNNYEDCRVTPANYITEAIDHIAERYGWLDVLYFPDEGAAKRYANEVPYYLPRVFGFKNRDWATGDILSLNIIGDANLMNKNILMIDDICSKGGTFYHSAVELKKRGAKNVFAYCTHCENSIFDGQLLNTNYVDRIYTTDSLITMEHPKIEVINIEY